jgi:hypothetical protein
MDSITECRVGTAFALIAPHVIRHRMSTLKGQLSRYTSGASAPTKKEVLDTRSSSVNTAPEVFSRRDGAARDYCRLGYDG